MADSIKDLQTLLAVDIIRSILDCNVIKIKQLNAVIAILIQANIDFDLSFTSGTRRSSPQATLTIFITPTLTIQFALVFDTGLKSPLE